jgi:hypothetical protein
MESALSRQLRLRGGLACLHEGLLGLVLIGERVVREASGLGGVEGSLVKTCRGLLGMHIGV